MNRGRHAVVIGGSMAGLLTAKVLADHFDRVSVIERDPFEEGPVTRKGVPQGRHVHGFWARGLAYLDRLLPGLSAELVAGGASRGDVVGDMLWHQFGHTKLRAPIGIVGTLMTRPFLEAQVRRRVAASPSIEFITGHAVEALTSDPARTRVTGVKLADGAAVRSLEADLVVDASGRVGLSTRWLSELGYEAPPESKVRIDVTYVTRFFERTKPRDAMAYVLVDTPPAGKRGSVCFAVEGNRWQLTLVGLCGEQPPLDDAGFLEYARSLSLPHVYDVARTERALGEAVQFKFPSNLRRHYERLRRFPPGLVVIGDALTSFNPAYGQGMTVAALEVEAFQALLQARAPLDGIATRFFARAAKIVDVPWDLTTGEDLRYPELEGKRGWHMPIINAYVGRVHRVAARDKAVCKAFFEVAGMQKPPQTLFAPNILLRTLLASRGAPPVAASESTLQAQP